MEDIIETSKLINQVMANKRESETYLQSAGYYTDWQEYHDLYHCIPDKKPYTWMSNKFIPLTSAKVKSVVSNIINTLFSQNPPFQVKPTEDMADKELADTIRRILNYQIQRVDIVNKFTDLAINTVVYGMGILKVYWDKQQYNRTIRIPKYEDINLNVFGLDLPIKTGVRQVGWDTQKQNIVTLDQPNFSVVNLSDFYFDPQMLNIQDGWVIHRVRRNLSYLRNNSKRRGGIYENEVENLTDADVSTANSGEQTANIETNMLRQTSMGTTYPQGAEPIELLEWWGKYDINKDGVLEPCILTVAAGKYLIRKEENPFWHTKNPFIKIDYNRIPNNFVGEGLPEETRDLQYLVNELVNQRNDNISLSLNVPIQYKKNSGVDVQRLVLKPGGVYGADEMEALKFVQIPDVTRVAFAQVGEAERWMQEVTQITKLTQGISGGELSSTATGMSILQRASGQRILMYLRQFEKGLNELLQMFYQLDYQFISPGDVINVAGEKGVEIIKITPELLVKDYNITATGVITMENKETKLLRLLQFYNIVKGNPNVKENVIMEKIYLLSDIGDNPDELLRTPEETSQQEEMQVAKQVALQRMGINEKSGNTSQMMGGEVLGTPGVPVQGTTVGQNQNF